MKGKKEYCVLIELSFSAFELKVMNGSTDFTYFLHNSFAPTIFAELLSLLEKIVTYKYYY